MKTNKTETLDNKKPVHHRKGIYIGTIVVLVIIVVTFIGAPLIGIGASNQNRVVFGTYNKKEIEYRSGNYFANVYEYLADEMNKNSPSINENFYQFQLRSLWRNAFDITVEHVAILDIARKSNTTISEDAISKLIIQNPRFQKDGKFSMELYRSVGNQEMLNLRNVSKEILLTTEIRDNLQKSVQLSTQEIEFSKEFLSDKRKFNFVTFELSEYPDTEIKEYGLTKAKEFRSLDLKQITLADEATADSVYNQLVNEEESFDALARLHSLDEYADQGGEVSVQYAYELADLLEDEHIDALFSYSESDYSDVYLTKDDQYVIFQLNKNPVLIEDELSEEQITTIRSYIESNDPDVIENYISEIANAFREDSLASTIEEAAEKYDKELITSESIGIDYGGQLGINEDLSQNDDLPFLFAINYREDFFETMFSLNLGEISEPLMIQRLFVVASLADTSAPTEKETETIEGEYPGLISDILEEYFRSVVVNEDKLKDNFTETYERLLQPEPPEEDTEEATG